MVIHRSNPQKDHPCAETRRLSHKASKSVQRFDLGVRSRKKGKDRTGQDRTVKKKSQGGNISPIWGEAPTVPFETKICMAGNLADVITCAKFQDEIFRGYDFPIDFCMGLTTVQRDCAACDTVPQRVPYPVLFPAHNSWIHCSYRALLHGRVPSWSSHLSN